MKTKSLTRNNRFNFIGPLSIRKKILFSNFVVLSALGVCLFIILTGAQKSNQEIELQFSSLEQQETALKAQQLFASVQYWMFDLAVSWLNESETNMEESSEEFQLLLASFKGEYKSLGEELSTSLDDYIELNLSAVDSYVEENRVQGNQRVAAGRLIASKINDSLAELVLRSSEKVSSAGIRITQSNNSLTKLLIIIFLALVVITVLVAFYSAHIVARELLSLQKTIDKVRANSDLRVRCVINNNDEVGGIGLAFNSMLDSFTSIVNEVIESSDRLNSESETVSTASSALIKDVRIGSEKADTVETATIEMNGAVKEVNNSVIGAIKATEKAHSAVAQGKDVVLKSAAVSASLVDEVKNAARVVEQLSDASNNIGKVIDVIRGIADQTNLLALNAAIEAARAGEQGRGFAVVADEVRTLAQRTQDSTAEIQRLVETLQAGTQEADLAMKHSAEQADTSTEFTEKTTAALEFIVDAIESISQSNAQISVSTNLQSKVSKGIEQNIVQISKLYEKSLEVSKTLSVSSQSLNALSFGLVESVKQFKI